MEWRRLTPEEAKGALRLWGRSRYPRKDYRITILPTPSGDRWEMVYGVFGNFTSVSGKTYQELREKIERLGLEDRVTNFEQARWLYVSRDEEGHVRDVVDGLYAAAVQFDMIGHKYRKALPCCTG